MKVLMRRLMEFGKYAALCHNADGMVTTSDEIPSISKSTHSDSQVTLFCRTVITNNGMTSI